MEGIAVNFLAVLGHIHVGANMPGYLPESDVLCFDNVQSAAEYLADELERAQGLMSENCSAENEEQQNKGSDCCEWCGEFWSIQTVLSGIRGVEHDVMHEYVRDNGYSYVHTPPAGAPVVHWMTNMAGTGHLSKCELWREQCADMGIAVDEDGCEVEIIDADSGDGTETEVI